MPFKYLFYSTADHRRQSCRPSSAVVLTIVGTKKCLGTTVLPLLYLMPEGLQSLTSQKNMQPHL